MSYAAERRFVSPHGALPDDAGEGGMPWEEGSGSSTAMHDSWLLSFIDILALLLTLFVLLLAYQDSEMKLADAEIPMVREAAPNFDISLGALGFMFRQQLLIPADLPVSEGYAMPGEGLLPEDIITVNQADTESVVPVAQGPAEITEEPVVPVTDAAIGEGELTQVENETLDVPEQAVSVTSKAPQFPENAVEVLLEVFEASELHDRVEVAVHPGEINLEISDSILFARASAALTDEGVALLKELAEVLSGQPYILSVEGHTDNIPIETTHFPSNWELSSARAAVVTRKLIEQGIAPEMVRAIGYGATRPLADNHSPEGRARNRRVSFILQVDVKEERTDAGSGL